MLPAFFPSSSPSSFPLPSRAPQSKHLSRSLPSSLASPFLLARLVSHPPSPTRAASRSSPVAASLASHPLLHRLPVRSPPLSGSRRRELGLDPRRIPRRTSPPPSPCIGPPLRCRSSSPRPLLRLLASRSSSNMQYLVKGRVVSLLLFFTLSTLVHRVGCAGDVGIEPPIHNNSAPPSQPHPATEDPCGNHTVRCVRAESGWDYFIPSFSSGLSICVFLAPIWRVLALQPGNRRPQTTLLWWFFCLNAGSYILWSFYFMHCRDRHYSVFPIFGACIIGGVIHSMLVLLTIMRTPASRDKRLRAAEIVGAICLIGGSIFSKTHGLGWAALGLTVVSHLCRMGSTDYHTNFTRSSGWSCFISAVGGVSALLWLFRPNLCISLEYKLSSYIVGCFRGVEMFLWGCRALANRYLSRLEGQVSH